MIEYCETCGSKMKVIGYTEVVARFCPTCRGKSDDMANPFDHARPSRELQIEIPDGISPELKKPLEEFNRFLATHRVALQKLNKYFQNKGEKINLLEDNLVFLLAEAKSQPDKDLTNQFLNLSRNAKQALQIHNDRG